MKCTPSESFPDCRCVEWRTLSYFVFLLKDCLLSLQVMSVDASVGISLEQAKGFSSLAERCINEPLPMAVPFEATSPLDGGNSELSLMPHQKRGVEWMLKLYYNGLGGVLADEMGLGKTVQVASFFSTLIRLRSFGTHLVVAPLVTLDNWEREIRKWCPLASVVVFHGTQDERDSKKRWLNKRQRDAINNLSLHALIGDENFPLGEITKHVGTVVVTSYEMVLKPNTPLGSTPFDTLIVDEAHRLKNTDCKLIRTLRRFKADSRILLTGTPLQNNIAELWSIINFVMPSMFPSSNAFEQWVASVENTQLSSSCTVTARAAKRMQFILRPFVLRRTKADIDLSLPPKCQVILRVRLGDQEKKLYNSIKNSDEESSLPKMNNTLMQLRKVCCHPFLVVGQNPFSDLLHERAIADWLKEERSRYHDALLASGSKLRMLRDMLVSLRRDGHRVLIFSQFTSVLDVIEDFLFMHNTLHEEDSTIATLTNCRLDGSNSREEKGDIVASFSSVNSVDPPFCFLISTRSGGVGINLVAADTVILFDGDFNPQNDFQAIDRCHRIGQTRPVAVYRLVCSETVEEAMLVRALGKVQMDRAIFTGGDFARTEEETPTAADAKKDDELLYKMTLSYNFGEDAQRTTSEELAHLLNRPHLVANAAAGREGGEEGGGGDRKRVRFE